MAHIQLSASKVPTIVIFNDAEGLFMSRKQSMAGNDPTDLVRVATTLFQGLDDLRGHPNLIMFATLNLSEALDEALLSRKAYILNVALPTFAERRAILANELAGIASGRLLDRLAEATEGKSGRDLVGLKQQAFLCGTGSPEELIEADFLRAVGLTPAVLGRNGSNGNGTHQSKEHGAAVLAEERVEEAAMVAATVTNGKEGEVCRNGQKASSRTGYQQAPSRPQTKSAAPVSWFERLRRCPSFPPLPSV